MSTDNKARSTAAELEKQFEKVLSPLQDFIDDQVVASGLLLLAAISALLIANSAFSDSYMHWLEFRFGLIAEDWQLQKSLHHWVNEGLMALFFFVVGLEVKREFAAGDLRHISSSIPVLASAVGGMLFPALIFTAFNLGETTLRGWGIAMATDTAFAIGVLFLLGKRVPRGLIAFLTALAIIDDIGATLAIAFFYSDDIYLPALLFSAALFLLLLLCNLLGIRRPWVYTMLGVLLWYQVLQSGCHATLAGILVALTVPARAKRSGNWFIKRLRRLTREFEKIETRKKRDETILAHDKQHRLVEKVRETVNKTATPLQHWQRLLAHPVSLLVLPIFALVNAGIPVDTDALLQVFAEPLGQGIFFGLVFGKIIGITLCCWITLASNLGTLPRGVTLSHIFGAACLGGMGFSMSIFIANLAFDEYPSQLIAAKMAILVSSIVAGFIGYLWLRWRAKMFPAVSNSKPIPDTAL